ncbi:MAG TPA: hypothetical protein VLH35_01510, partial [Candidatus Acidoferrales bacterium]|nr:hypothetical protein [Candidatus Acidoferrales bacterium]
RLRKNAYFGARVCLRLQLVASKFFKQNGLFDQLLGELAIACNIKASVWYGLPLSRKIYIALDSLAY